MARASTVAGARAIQLTAQIKNKAALSFSKTATEIAQEEVTVGSNTVADLFINIITTYPRETPGNKPPAPYWRRGTGRILKKAGINPVSERLGDPRSWVKRREGSDIVVATAVSYANVVVGNNTQAAVHAATGWLTTDEALADAFNEYGGEPSLVERVTSKISNVFKRIFGS